MSCLRFISIAAASAFCLTYASIDASAAVRGGAVAARGGAVAAGRGAVGYRGGAVGYRGGIYNGGYYRPGLGLAAGAVVGGAIAASQYGYGGGYGYGYPGYYGDSGYSPGYASGSYAPDNGYGYGSPYPAGYTAPASAYGPDYGPAPVPYFPSCTYVGGPKSGDWSCR